MDINARNQIAHLVRIMDHDIPDAIPEGDALVSLLSDACLSVGILPDTDDTTALYMSLSAWLDETRPAYLKQLRKDRRITFREVRELAGIPKPTLEKWESGQGSIRKATAWNVLLLARLYNVPVAELLY